MNSLRNIAITVCAGVLLVSVLQFLIPNKKFKRVITPIMLSFLVLLCFNGLSAMKDFHFSLESVALEQPFEPESFAQNALINAANKSVKEQIETLLNQKRISFESIDVTMNISREKGILINEVRIGGVKPAQKQKAHDLLKKKLGLEVVFT